MRFSFMGCRVEISFWFAAAVCLWLLMDTEGMFFAGICAAFFHETGHIVAILFCKRHITSIRLSVFGAEIRQEGYRAESLKKDIAVSLAGPFMNLFLFVWFWILSGNILFPFAAANIALALVNLAPVEPLDGGQALYAALCLCINENTALRVLEWVSFFALIPLGICGFLLVFRSVYNFSLLFFSAYGVIYLILKRRDKTENA